jgi:chloramphenicol O-acetyltransferase type A
MKIIELNKWKRKEHFEHFLNYDNPYFGITSEINCSYAYTLCKKNRISFFLFNLHKILKTVNLLESFKLRILNNKPILLESVNVLTTIARTDNYWGYSYLTYTEDFNDFRERALSIIEETKNSNGLMFEQHKNKIDYIHFSAIPNIHYSSISNARTKKYMQSIPKINTGKIIKKNDMLYIPISVNMHHSLADAGDIYLFLSALEVELNK